MTSRPFDDYRDQPDTAERKRLEIQLIPFALPEIIRMTYVGLPVKFDFGGEVPNSGIDEVSDHS